MKYPITATADGYALSGVGLAVTSVVADAWRFFLRHWGLLAALVLTVSMHLPTLGDFFVGDDFVVLGSVEYLGTKQYLADTFLMRDIVPNWRPLTGAIYAVEWDLFGLNAMPWRIVNLSVHVGSMTLLYALVARVTRRPMAGAVAAAAFGVSGSHFDTVTYVTALPHVLALFFILGSLLALVSYAQDGERNRLAFALSFALFALAFLANEGDFVYAPVLVAAYALFAQRWRRAPLRLVLHAAPFVALAGGWLLYYQTASLDQIKFEDYYWGPHVVRNYAIYLSWIAFPAHGIPTHADALRWILGGGMLGLLVVLAALGPNLARVAALGVALALLPFVPVEIWTASRYTYAAVAFFAMIAGVAGYAAYDRARRLHRWAHVPVTALALAFVAVVAGLYSWQSYAQNDRFGRETERWSLLVNELRRNYGDVPDGTTIYIIDGHWQNPMEQYTWVPSVARALYGDAAAFDLPREQYLNDPPDAENAIFLEWTDGGLRPVPREQVLSGR